jgi:hypothetical protein
MFKKIRVPFAVFVIGEAIVVYFVAMWGRRLLDYGLQSLFLPIGISTTIRILFGVAFVVLALFTHNLLVRFLKRKGVIRESTEKSRQRIKINE